LVWVGLIVNSIFDILGEYVFNLSTVLISICIEQSAFLQAEPLVSLGNIFFSWKKNWNAWS